MNSPAPALKRFPYLDSARGLAALSVVTWHYIVTFFDYHPGNFFTDSPLHFFWYGEADVIFFFIHSGFILTYSYADEKKRISAGSYIRFLIERVFRIYPLFLFVLLVSFILKKSVYPLSPEIYTTKHIQFFWSGDYNWQNLLKDAALIFPSKGEAFYLIPQEWTLTVEVLVGPLVPILAFLLRKIKWIWLYWILVIVSLKFFGMNTYLFEFAIGVCLFYNWQKINDLWKRLNIFIRIGAVVVSLVLYTCIFHFSNLFNLYNIFLSPGADRLLVGLGCTGFFCMIISSGFIQRIMSLPLLVKIGKACYSLYLLHMLFLICFAEYFIQQLHRFMPIPACLIVFFIIYIILSVLLSFMTFAFIERPCSLLGKRISRQVEALFRGKVVLVRGQLK
ncbi:acyltransferase family protein [Flavitalea flava]